MKLALYIKVLNHLKKFEGLPLEFHSDGKNLWIDKIPFIQARSSDLFQTNFSAKGILSPRLTQKEKEFCRAYNISYLTTDGSLYLVRKKSVLSIERKETTKRKQKTKPSKPTWLRTANEQKQVPQKPTDLISPNAFAILDVLFKLPENQLSKFNSGFQFAKSFDLYQPKLSILMSTMQVHSLIELRHAVSRLPTEWWVSALRYPATRRVFTPFFVHAKPYHSLLELSEEKKYEKYLSFILSKEKNQIAPGPTEVAKEYGFLRDKDHAIWATQETLQTLKRELRLVPGIEQNTPTWFLATPVHGFRQEAIQSHLMNKELQSSNRQTSTPTNILRTIWDLSYGDSRLAEVQIEMLKRVFK